jgi:hypothetical protein
VAVAGDLHGPHETDAALEVLALALAMAAFQDDLSGTIEDVGRLLHHQNLPTHRVCSPL